MPFVTDLEDEHRRDVELLRKWFRRGMLTNNAQKMIHLAVCELEGKWQVSAIGLWVNTERTSMNKVCGEPSRLLFERIDAWAKDNPDPEWHPELHRSCCPWSPLAIQAKAQARSLQRTKEATIEEIQVLRKWFKRGMQSGYCKKMMNYLRVESNLNSAFWTDHRITDWIKLERSLLSIYAGEEYAIMCIAIKWGKSPGHRNPDATSQDQWFPWDKELSNYRRRAIRVKSEEPEDFIFQPPVSITVPITIKTEDNEDVLGKNLILDSSHADTRGGQSNTRKLPPRPNVASENAALSRGREAKRNAEQKGGTQRDDVHQQDLRMLQQKSANVHEDTSRGQAKQHTGSHVEEAQHSSLHYQQARKRAERENELAVEQERLALLNEETIARKIVERAREEQRCREVNLEESRLVERESGRQQIIYNTAQSQNGQEPIENHNHGDEDNQSPFLENNLQTVDEDRALPSPTCGQTTGLEEGVGRLEMREILSRIIESSSNSNEHEAVITNENPTEITIIAGHDPLSKVPDVQGGGIVTTIEKRLEQSDHENVAADQQDKGIVQAVQGDLISGEAQEVEPLAISKQRQIQMPRSGAITVNEVAASSELVASGREEIENAAGIIADTAQEQAIAGFPSNSKQANLVLDHRDKGKKRARDQPGDLQTLGTASNALNQLLKTGRQNPSRNITINIFNVKRMKVKHLHATQDGTQN